jgi:hypothetical protein
MSGNVGTSLYCVKAVPYLSTGIVCFGGLGDAYSISSIVDSVMGA